MSFFFRGELTGRLSGVRGEGREGRKGWDYKWNEHMHKTRASFSPSWFQGFSTGVLPFLVCRALVILFLLGTYLLGWLLLFVCFPFLPHRFGLSVAYGFF